MGLQRYPHFLIRADDALSTKEKSMILDNFSLQGKVAVVTGCDTGLGQGMALGLAQAGCDIVGINVVEPTETIAKVAELGRRFLSLKADLSNLDVLPSLIERAVAEFGHIDILVNNAGIIRRQDALEFSEKDWDDVMNLNIKTVFFMSQAVARQFIAQGKGGKIINIASMLSYQGGIRVPSYTASKSAVMGVTRLLANEWASHGINVNALAPGYMATNNTRQLRDDQARSEAILERIPAGRWGLPEDLMGPAVFLASPASDYVNGFTLAVDGGWLAR
jgi:2-deoxy-D-gluconate 3-dehydrogenase